MTTPAEQEVTNQLPWNERITMLSIHPDAANRDDIARMAAELMECRAAATAPHEFTPSGTGDKARRCGALLPCDQPPEAHQVSAPQREGELK